MSRFILLTSSFNPIILVKLAHGELGLVDAAYSAQHSYHIRMGIGRTGRIIMQNNLLDSEEVVNCILTDKTFIR